MTLKLPQPANINRAPRPALALLSFDGGARAGERPNA
jgi:hypothetical protein